MRGQASTDCLAVAVIELGHDVSLRPHGAIGCIPNEHAESTRER